MKSPTTQHDLEQNSDYYSTYLCADDKDKFEKRWENAQECVALSVKKFDEENKPSGTYKEYEPVREPHNYSLANLFLYMNGVVQNYPYAYTYIEANYIVK